MKLDNHNSKEKVELSVQKKQEKEKFVFDGILKPKPNQRVFKLDLKEMTVSEVLLFTEGDTIKYLDALNNKRRYKERNIVIKEGFDYVIKLNMENAIKHFCNVWKEKSICESEESKANSLVHNQRVIKKLRNNK